MRFIDPSHQNYFFKDHNTANNVPVDGLYLLMENIWTTIKDCKDINLPNQKTLVANVRCTDIKKEIEDSLKEKINNLKSRASKDIYQDFGKEGESIINEALDRYDAETENYDKTVVAEKRKELRNGLLQILQEAFAGQISIIRKKATHDLTTKLAEIKINPEQIGNVMEKVKTLQDDVFKTFEKSVQSVIVSDSDWNTENVISEVQQQMNETITMFREKQLAFLLKQKSTQIRREIEAETVRLFNNLDNDFWTVLDNFYNETLRTSESYLRSMLSGILYINISSYKSAR